MAFQPAALEVLTASCSRAAALGALVRLRGPGEDARSLWHLHGRKLDDERIRRTLRLLEEALGQSDLLPGFESIRGRGSR